MHDRHPLPTPAHRGPAATACPMGRHRRVLAASRSEDPASLERVPALSSGCPALDRALPEKGFRPGTLVEWLFRGEGDGTATLAFRAACRGRACGGGAVVVLDRTRRVLSLGGGCPRDRARPADRRSSRQQGRPHLGLGPGVALPGRGRGGRLAGIARRKTRRPDLPPAATGRGTRRRPGPVDPAGKRAAASPPGPTCGCWSNRCPARRLWPGTVAPVPGRGGCASCSCVAAAVVANKP